jgi:hypothetical protein
MDLDHYTRGFMKQILIDNNYVPVGIVYFFSVSKLKANKANNVNNFHFVTIKEVSRPEKS